jgi:hypothetical protein
LRNTPIVERRLIVRVVQHDSGDVGAEHVATGRNRDDPATIRGEPIAGQRRVSPGRLDEQKGEGEDPEHIGLYHATVDEPNAQAGQPFSGGVHGGAAVRRGKADAAAGILDDGDGEAEARGILG